MGKNPDSSEGLGCQENSLEASLQLLLPRGEDFQCLLLGQPSVTQRLRGPGRRGAKDQMWGSDGVSAVPRVGEWGGGMGTVTKGAC